MKKLMIAAAVAAMIGGAQADMVYDFSATLKTTKAKAGSATTKTIQVGRERTAGQWWYEDTTVFTPSAKTGFLDYGAYEQVVKINSATGVGTLQANRLDNAGKVALATDLLAYSDVIDSTTGDTYGLPEVYKGKIKWCAKWSYKIDGTCIRTKASETVKAKYTINDCCADMKFTMTEGIVGDLDLITLYRFGGVIGSKCTNVELVGSIGEGVTAATPYTTIPAFALAGQGTWSDKQKNSNKVVAPGIASVSGDIVGIWYESECEVCCGLDASSLAYSCDLTAHNIAGYIDADGIVGDDTVPGLVDAIVGLDQWGTAAFGTFTLKFNSKESN